MQFPPSANISKQSDGNYSYSGFSFEIVKYAAEALNIRSKTEFLLLFIYLLNNYLFHSYEMIHIELKDVKKYGAGPVQVKAVEKDVRSIAKK